jgi:HEAT repeat protein
MRGARLLFYPIVVLLAAGGLYAWHRYVRRNAGDDLETWLKRADSADAGERLRAADALGRMGRDSDKAWAALARMTVYDGDIDVQNMAVDHLQRLCQPNPAMNDPEQLQRKRAAIQSLLDALKKADPEVRERTPVVLFDVAGMEYHEQVLKRINDDQVDREMRPLVVDAFVAALNDNVKVRSEAIWCLKCLNRVPAAAEPGLLAALDDEDPETRHKALIALDRVDTLSENCIPALVVAVQDERQEIAKEALACLEHVGKPAAPALRAAREKSTGQKRVWLEAALIAIKEDPDK